MSVHSFTVKVVQNEFKLFAQYITDTASGYNFKTLAQSLTLNKQQYQVNDTLIGSVDFAGIANNPWGPELPDYFAKIQGTIKCKLQPWNAFQVKRYGIRWDNKF